LKDAFPGYIDWEEFMANQRRLADNFNRYDTHRQGCRGGAMRCCKALLFVAGAAAGWGCIIPGRTATIRSMFVAPTSINIAGHAARRCEPWASMLQSKDCCSKR
jgi:hypothetical protein